MELATLEATQRLAFAIGEQVAAPLTIALVGTLGTGKTQFVRFLAQSLGVAPEDVTSPTYVLHQRYSGRIPIHHFDFYRLDTVDQVWDLGIDELYEQNVLVLIEWADKFSECLPDDYLRIALDPQIGGSRVASISGTGPRARTLASAISSANNSSSA